MSNIAVERIKETIDGFERLINIINTHKGSDNICRLSKKEISNFYGLSYTGTLKKINVLLKYGLIIQVPGGFKPTKKDIFTYLPFGALLVKILILVFKKPSVYSSFKEQSEILSVSFEDIQSAWGYYALFFGSKYPEKDEVDFLKQNDRECELDLISEDDMINTLLWRYQNGRI